MKWARDGGGGEEETSQVHGRPWDLPPSTPAEGANIEASKAPNPRLCLPAPNHQARSCCLWVILTRRATELELRPQPGGKIGNGEGERGSIEQRGRPREGGQTQFEGESRGMSSPAVTQPTLVVTHVYSSSPRAAGPAVPTGANTAYTQKFLEGEPNALGVAQILIGLVQITFGLPLAIVTNSVSTNLGIPFLIGTVFIVSGAVSIAAEKNPQIKLLRTCLAMNIISSLMAGLGVIMYTIAILLTPYCMPYNELCASERDFNITIYYMNVIFLIFTLLEFILCIVVSAFVCKATRCCHPYSSMPMILLDSSTADEQ